MKKVWAQNEVNKTSLRGARKKRRSHRGVIMATAELVISVSVFIAASLFLGDLGQVCTYKEKLSSVLSQAANYAVNLPATDDPTHGSEIEMMVKELCKKNNLSLSNVKVTVENTTIDKAPAITVKAVANVPLFAGSVLPSAVSFADQSSCLIPANRVCATIAISPAGYSGTTNEAFVYIPVVTPPQSTAVWQFPYDATLNNLRIEQGTAPASVNASSGTFNSLY